MKFVFRGKQLCTFNLNIIKNYNVDTLVLLSMHSNPWYPLSHPFIHVPLMCWHCSEFRQFPHVMLHSFPYSPFVHAKLFNKPTFQIRTEKKRISRNFNLKLKRISWKKRKNGQEIVVIKCFNDNKDVKKQGREKHIKLKEILYHCHNIH